MDDKSIVKYQTDSGEITLSPDIVRKYLVNGNGAVTNQEIALFLALCKFHRLNPFLRDAYLVKFGTQQATIITGKEAFMKRAMKAKDCKGFKAGIVFSTDKNGGIDYTDGVIPPGHKLIGGWAEVYKEGWVYPLRVEVSFDEYVGKTKDGFPNRMWTEKPATMIRKVALVQALREAFPEDLGGMYSPEELETDEGLPHTPIPVEAYRDADYLEPKTEPENQGQTADKGQVFERSETPPGPIGGNGSQTVFEPTEKPAQQPPPEEPKRRRRANKWQVDKALFGSEELVTCGSTPDQLLVLKAIIRGQDKMKADAVKAHLKSIGYAELGYLTKAEAEDLIGNGAKQEEPPIDIDPRADESGASESIGDRVDCPMAPGEMILRSFCLDQCTTRERDGFCPVIDQIPGGGPLL